MPSITIVAEYKLSTCDSMPLSQESVLVSIEAYRNSETVTPYEGLFEKARAIILAAR